MASRPQRPRKKRNQPQPSDAQQLSVAPKRRKLWLLEDDPITRLTGWVATFTGLLAIIGCFQLWAFIQSEGSSLTITDFQFVGGITPNKPVILTFIVKNSGQSTADLVEASVNYNFSLPASSSDYKVYPLNTGPVPGHDQQLEIFNALTSDGSQPRQFSSEEAPMIADGSKQFFIYGYIKYRDAFSLWRTRRSEFCFHYLASFSTPTTNVFGGCSIKS